MFAILNGFLRDHGKNIDAPSLVDSNFVAEAYTRCDKAACAYFVAAIFRFEFVRPIAATKIFTCHTMQFVAATCRGDVSQRFVAQCVSAFRLQ